MRYVLKELLDIPLLQSLLFSLYEINSMPTAILDLEGNILTATAWQNICTDFHRLNPDSVKKCIESDNRINANLSESGDCYIYRCPMGLMDCAIPIIIDGERLGNVFIGQFFIEQPDESYFMKQAHQYGYDENNYLEALRKVPIFSEKQIYKNMKFIGEFVQMQADQGVLRNKQLENEADLRKTEKKLKIIFDNMEAGLIVVSPSGVITIANRRMATMFSMSMEELIDTYYVDHLHESDRLEGTKSLGQITDGIVKSVEVDRHYLRKDGTDFWGHLTGMRFENADGSMLDQIIVISDITARKLVEEENKLLEKQLQHAQKMESLGVLAGGVAHDFNNILTVIIGNCYFAKSNPEEADKRISIIENAAERAAGLCRQMLAYAGKASIEMAEVDILALVNDMVNMLKSSIPQNVEIKFSISTNIPFIKGDVSQLGQIIVNLIINASEAIGNEKGEILIALSIKDIQSGQPDTDHLGKVIQAGRYVCLEITDNGCGMDDDIKQKMFEPFYTTKVMGRGLGMSAVLGLISLHKGSLQLTSQPGSGTTFKVYLPAQTGEFNRDLNSQQILSSELRQGNGTILLVEDTEQLKLMLKTMLETLGFTVIDASNGKEALELYQKGAADIKMVLTDIGMPIMDGYELFRELKKLNPELPIIISSGYGETAVTSRIEREEIAGIVNKPYSFNQLQEVLKNLVKDTQSKHA